MHLWDQLEVFQVDSMSFTQNDDSATPYPIFVTKMGKSTGWGFGGVNPFCNAASMIGNTGVCALTAKQVSFRKDVTIWLEVSTTSASYLITDDKRFYPTFESCYMMDVFKVCREGSFQIKPVTLVLVSSSTSILVLVSATEYLGLPTEIN